jgi:glycosyltransferase involved in cell wall biosynthesis
VNNGGYPAALSARAAVIAARRAGIERVVMVVNNQAESHRGLPISPRPLVDRQVVKSVSRFITGSTSAAERLRRVLHLREDQTLTLPNGIALRAATETRAETLARLGLDATSGVLFGVVALMVPRKGHRVLIDAVAQLVRDATSTPAFTVLLEGEGPLRAELEAAVRERGLERQCRFVGTEANVVNFMSAIDVLVLPSVAHEDFPNVVLEAMGLGKAVIASRLAGTPEQVEDGETGLLVAPGDSAELARAMERLVADPDVREAMGRAGRRRFEARFTAEAAVHRYTALYQSLMSEHQS